MPCQLERSHRRSHNLPMQSWVLCVWRWVFPYLSRVSSWYELSTSRCGVEFNMLSVRARLLESPRKRGVHTLFSWYVLYYASSRLVRSL